jgi:zinc protease
MISFGAEVRQEKSLDDARTTLVEVIEDLKKYPPTEEEVTRARTRLLKNFELSLKRSDQVGLRLSESIALGDWRLAFLDRDRLEKVTPADVARVASAYLKASNRTIGLFIPEENADRAITPAAPDLAPCSRITKASRRFRRVKTLPPRRRISRSERRAARSTTG